MDQATSPGGRALVSLLRDHGVVIEADTIGDAPRGMF